MENKKIIKKLLDARLFIKKEEVKMDGKNTFRDYKYFSPQNVSNVTTKACGEFGLFTKFDIVSNELGHVGILKIFDVESGESIEYTMETSIPEIKGASSTQNLGGMYTYTKRYMLMNAFDISDNSEDLDNNKEPVKQTATQPKNQDIKWLTEDQFSATLACNDFEKVQKTLAVYSSESKKMKKEYRDKIEEHLKTLKNN